MLFKFNKIAFLVTIFSLSWADMDSSSPLLKVEDLKSVSKGDRIGLKFKRTSIQLNIDTHNKVFNVQPLESTFSYNDGDKLVDIDFVDEKYILNESWIVMEISKDRLLLKNEVIHGKTIRHMIFEINKNEINGFYKSNDPMGEEFLYSYYLIIS